MAEHERNYYRDGPPWSPCAMLAAVSQGAAAMTRRQPHTAVLLVVGDKSGVKERLFCRRLIANADQRFDAHLERIGKRRR